MIRFSENVQIRTEAKHKNDLFSLYFTLFGVLQWWLLLRICGSWQNKHCFSNCLVHERHVLTCWVYIWEVSSALSPLGTGYFIFQVYYRERQTSLENYETNLLLFDSHISFPTHSTVTGLVNINLWLWGQSKDGWYPDSADIFQQLFTTDCK